MYNFQTQNAVGKTVEIAHEILFTEADIPFERNPATGTSDPSRAFYDYRLGNLLLEVKGNPASNETGNVAIEVDILEVSKSHYFSIAYVNNGIWGAEVIDRQDVWSLLNTASYSDARGKFYKYPRVEAGQFKRPSMLVPIHDLLMKGVPIAQFLNALQQ